MEYCFYCGSSDEEKKMFGAVSKEGIIPLCEDCVYKTDFPIIRKPEEKEMRSKTVRERLSVMAGIGKEKRDTEVKIPSLEETRLKRLVERNMKLGVIKKVQPEDLIDNYHWTLMRERRARKLSAKQLGEHIGETEMTVKMAEEGILPENYHNLISKFESAYKIKLRKNNPDNPNLFINVNQQKNLPRFLDFSSPEKLKNLTIDDLRRIKQMKEQEKQDQSATINEKETENIPEEKEERLEKRGFFSFLKRKKKNETAEEVEEKVEEEKD